MKFVRRTTSDVCAGIVLYLAVFMGAQYFLYDEHWLVCSLLTGDRTGEPSDFIMGMIVLVSLLLGLILSWLYFGSKAEKGRLFEGASLKQAVFETRERMSFWGLIGCMAGIFLLQFAFVPLLGLLETLFNHFGYTLQYNTALNEDYTASWSLMAYAVILGPLAEEIVYRGYALKGLEANGRKFAMIVSAIFFGLMHGDMQQSLFTFVMGLLLAYVGLRYSFWYTLLLHIYNNGVLGEGWTWFGTHASEELYIGVWIAVLALSIVLTVVALRKKGKDMVRWIREGEKVRGAWRSLFNPWFLLFLVYAGFEIVYSVSPL